MSFLLFTIASMKNEELLEFYYNGWELSYKDKNFPMWFKSEYEKSACLLGYNDFQFGIIREKEDILEELK